MEFLVRIEVDLPPDMPAERRGELLASELVRGRELIVAGKLKRIWRLPGGLRNLSLYEVRDATELHEALASLPLFPWLRTEVIALATHPLEAE